MLFMGHYSNGYCVQTDKGHEAREQKEARKKKKGGNKNEDLLQNVVCTAAATGRF
ncbi:unnamed protein product [Ectocarpus sp. 6 AP-2014]